MKKISAFIAAAAISSSLFAFDFGGNFVNNTALKNITGKSDLKLDQLDELSAWLSVPFNNEGTTSLTISGRYQFEKDYNAYNEAKTTNFVDADTIKLSHQTETIGISLGRFAYSDLSGSIITQTLDGMYFSYNKDFLAVSLLGAYTGLLNNHFNSILREDLFSYQENDDKAYDLAEKYAVGAIKFSLPYLFANQSIALEDSVAVHTEGKNFLRNYATVHLTGPITNSLFYTLSSTIGYGKFDELDPEISNLSKLNISYFKDNMAFAINGAYASDNFIGFTSQTAVNSNRINTEYNSLAKGGISLSVKPLANLLLAASGNGIFDASDSIEYAGLEYSALINWQIVSDVSASADISQYFDKNNSDFNKTSISIKAVITF